MKRITSVSHDFKNGDRIYINGEGRAARVLPESTDTILNVRPWKWHDWLARAYWRVVRWVRSGRSDKL